MPLAATTYYFSSIDDLLGSALEHSTEEEIARFRDTAEKLRSTVNTDPDPGELAELLLAALAGERKVLIAQYELMLEATRRPALRESARRSTEAYVELAAELLARVGCAEPRTDARLLVAAFDGLLLEALSEPCEFDPDTLRPPLTRLLTALSAPVPALR